MNHNIGTAVFLAVVFIAGLIESILVSLLTKRKFVGTYLSFLLHFSPLWIGLILLPWPENKPHTWRLLLLLLLLSIIFRLSWHAAGRVGPKAAAVLAACGALVIASSKLLKLPPCLVTSAMLAGLFGISLIIRLIVSDRIKTRRPNLAAFLASICFLVLFDAGLSGSYWRWDLRLLGPSRGYTLDSLAHDLGVEYFRQPRDIKDQSVKLAPSGRFRIMLLGGSSTFGQDVKLSERFQAVLTRDFNSQGRDIEVINGGFGKYVSALMVIDAVEGYRLTEPDLVLLYMGFNDCGLITRFNYTIGPEPRTEQPQRPVVDFVRRRPLYQLLDRLLAQTRSQYRPPESTPRVSGSALAENLILLKEVYGESGGRLLLFLEASRERWPECRETVKAAAIDAGIEVVDTDQILRDTFTSTDDYMLDAVHPKPIGHWAIAEIMEGALLDRGLIK